MSIANTDCSETTTTTNRAVAAKYLPANCLYEDSCNIRCCSQMNRLPSKHSLDCLQNKPAIISKRSDEHEGNAEGIIHNVKEEESEDAEWREIGSCDISGKIAESMNCSFQRSLLLEDASKASKDSEILNCSPLTSKKPHRRKRIRYGVTRRKEYIKPTQKSLNATIQQASFHRPNFINTVILGNYEMDTWFWSPYPNECVSAGAVYLCEKCLELKKSLETLQNHIARCKAVYPPGDEIFRQDDISVFEVDGEKAKIYCQHLCMLGKLFIDHKALFYDVEPFLFYIATLWRSSGLHLVGYFSKQKHSEEKHNLSCIVTLPCYQERGFGRFLIDFSFLLTRREKILGSAEKPLSDLGLIAYRSYWRTAILEFLYLKKERDGSFCQLSVDEIARATGIEHDDVVQTLNGLEMLSVDDDSIFLDINFTAVRCHWEEARKDPRRIWIDENNLKILMVVRRGERIESDEEQVGYEAWFHALMDSRANAADARPACCSRSTTTASNICLQRHCLPIDGKPYGCTSFRFTFDASCCVYVRLNL